VNMKPVHNFLRKHFVEKKDIDIDAFQNAVIRKASRIAKQKVVPEELLVNSGRAYLAFNPKNTLLRAYMANNFETLKGEDKLDYSSSSISIFMGEFLADIFRMCRNYEKVTISMGKDYPMKVETEDFVIILAPRVEN
jgi:hypothetical protein